MGHTMLLQDGEVLRPKILFVPNFDGITKASRECREESSQVREE
jgi:hypothetical protein